MNRNYHSPNNKIESKRKIKKETSHLLYDVINKSQKKLLKIRRKNEFNISNNNQKFINSEPKSDDATAQKPLNWKLQKLEKDFLYNCLDTALKKYQRNNCRKVWLDNRGRDFMISTDSRIARGIGKPISQNVNLYNSKVIENRPLKPAKLYRSDRIIMFRHMSTQTILSFSDIPITIHELIDFDYDKLKLIVSLTNLYYNNNISPDSLDNNEVLDFFIAMSNTYPEYFNNTRISELMDLNKMSLYKESKKYVNHEKQFDIKQKPKFSANITNDYEPKEKISIDPRPPDDNLPFSTSITQSKLPNVNIDEDDNVDTDNCEEFQVPDSDEINEGLNLDETDIFDQTIEVPKIDHNKNIEVPKIDNEPNDKVSTSNENLENENIKVPEITEPAEQDKQSLLNEINKSKEDRISESYPADGSIFQSPAVLNVTDDFVEVKSSQQSGGSITISKHDKQSLHSERNKSIEDRLSEPYGVEGSLFQQPDILNVTDDFVEVKSRQQTGGSITMLKHSKDDEKSEEKSCVSFSLSNDTNDEMNKNVVKKLDDNTEKSCVSFTFSDLESSEQSEKSCVAFSYDLSDNRIFNTTLFNEAVTLSDIYDTISIKKNCSEDKSNNLILNKPSSRNFSDIYDVRSNTDNENIGHDYIKTSKQFSDLLENLFRNIVEKYIDILKNRNLNLLKVIENESLLRIAIFCLHEGIFNRIYSSTFHYPSSSSMRFNILNSQDGVYKAAIAQEDAAEIFSININHFVFTTSLNSELLSAIQDNILINIETYNEELDNDVKTVLFDKASVIQLLEFITFLASHLEHKYGKELIQAPKNTIFYPKRESFASKLLCLIFIWIKDFDDDVLGYKKCELKNKTSNDALKDLEYTKQWLQNFIMENNDSDIELKQEFLKTTFYGHFKNYKASFDINPYDDLAKAVASPISLLDILNIIEITESTVQQAIKCNITIEGLMYSHQNDDYIPDFDQTKLNDENTIHQLGALIKYWAISNDFIDYKHKNEIILNPYKFFSEFSFDDFLKEVIDEDSDFPIIIDEFFIRIKIYCLQYHSDTIKCPLNELRPIVEKLNLDDFLLKCCEEPIIMLQLIKSAKHWLFRFCQNDFVKTESIINTDHELSIGKGKYMRHSQTIGMKDYIIQSSSYDLHSLNNIISDEAFSETLEYKVNLRNSNSELSNSIKIQKIEENNIENSLEKVDLIKSDLEIVDNCISTIRIDESDKQNDQEISLIIQTTSYNDLITEHITTHVHNEIENNIIDNVSLGIYHLLIFFNGSDLNRLL